MNRVSIIIPAFNHARYLAQAAESAAAQTYPDVEVIVVDDGSTDGTPEVCEALACHPRIRVIRQENAGVGAARNRGIAESTGQYLCFLDADDFYHPEKVARQAEVLDATSVGFTYCDIVTVDEQGAPNGDLYSVGESRTALHGDILDSLLMGGYFPPHTVMVRRSVLEEVGEFDPLLGGHADLDLWMRIAAAGHAAEFVDERLAFYRALAGGMSRDTEHMRRTRLGALAKIARLHPARMAHGVAAVQQVNADLHAVNNWLHHSLERALRVFDSEGSGTGQGIERIAAIAADNNVRAEVWDVAIDGVRERALMLHPPNALAFPVSCSDPGRFVGAVALHPDVWDRAGSGPCQFTVTVDDRVQWTCVVDPRRMGDRGWLPFGIDVPATDGEHRIRLETTGVSGNAFRWALWRDLRFVQASFSSQKLQPQAGCTPL